MADTIKDLDALAPEPKKVKVNGNIYDIKPARLQDFIAIQKLFLKLKQGDAESGVVALGEMIETLKPIVPDIEEMGLTISQTMALLQFAYQDELTAQPQTEEKKTDQ